MCTTHFHQHSCTHLLPIRLSTCNAHFQIPTRILARTKHPRHLDAAPSRKPACSGFADLVLRLHSKCPACARAEAETALVGDLGTAERQAREWEICRMIPDIRLKCFPKRKGRGERRGRGSLLRTEVRPEDVTGETGWGEGDGDGDGGGWAKEGDEWEWESTPIVDWGAEDHQECGERTGRDKVGVEGGRSVRLDEKGVGLAERETDESDTEELTRGTLPQPTNSGLDNATGSYRMASGHEWRDSRTDVERGHQDRDWDCSDYRLLLKTVS